MRAILARVVSKPSGVEKGGVLTQQKSEMKTVTIFEGLTVCFGQAGRYSNSSGFVLTTSSMRNVDRRSNAMVANMMSNIDEGELLC